MADGEGRVCDTPAKKEHALVLGPGDTVTAASTGSMRFLLIAGKPIGEPIVQHGPFVMSTKEEI